MLANEAEAGLENPVLNVTGLTSPLYDAWSAPVASMTVSAHTDAAAAKQILQRAGYTIGSNGFFQKGGKTVSITIVDPSAYSDYAEVDSIVAQELRAVGIDATFQGLSVDAWNSDVASDNFQLTSHWSNGGITRTTCTTGLAGRRRTTPTRPASRPEPTTIPVPARTRWSSFTWCRGVRLHAAHKRARPWQPPHRGRASSPKSRPPY